jgi:dipeptidyl aminopeptidase/acylaminoacyl peptidase
VSKEVSEVRPYGSWPSPVTAELLVAGASTPSDVRAAGGVTWWSESRPEEAGRIQLVRRDADGTTTDLLPDGLSARTRVHEYGGGAWWVHGETVFFAAWHDQRLYRLEPGGGPVPITPEPPEHHGWRYADGTVTPDGRWIVCVREVHDGATPSDVRNQIVALAADGSTTPRVLADGRDFVAAPRISRDGRQLAWLTWDHPDMPWDGTELWVGHLHETLEGLALEHARREAGSRDESLVQPEWGRHGQLFVVSDRTGWWNVHRVDGPDSLADLDARDAEAALPMWVFGGRRYAVARDGTIAVAYAGTPTRLAVLREGVAPVVHELPVVALGQLCLDGGTLTALADHADREREVVRFLLDDPSAIEVLRPARSLGLDPDLVSRAAAVSFPSTGGRTAHAWFYAPRHPSYVGEPGELPPLVVMSHGGPTSSADPSFSLQKQFWTSRGFAVVDVDYGGSSGYGRAYRQALDGAWGIVDVDDCCAAATWLAGEGRVDGERLVIRGGSAGGYTTLAALAFRDVFAAGGDHYGVADLAALARDTHKFEARYCDGLVGPWPAAEAVYAERSPIEHVERFSCPLIVFQGLEDAIVPPAQAEMIVAALDAKGVPHAYFAFEGEQHGFRQAATIVRVLTAEVTFYRKAFGIPGDEGEPFAIAHDDQLPVRRRAG